MSIDVTDTKSKILEVANNLFCDKGFDGTSVRDIAGAALVNVAAVNYHFTNKENLFFSVITNSFNKASEDITRICARHNHFEECVVEVFRYFLVNDDHLIHHFKMLMSPQGESFLRSISKDSSYLAPPGHGPMSNLFDIEVGYKVTSDDKNWALMVIYGQIAHNVIMNKCLYKNNMNIPFTSESEIVESFRKLVNMILRDIKSKVNLA